MTSARGRFYPGYKNATRALKCLPITKNGCRLINIVWLPMPVEPKKAICRKDNGTTKKARNPEYAARQWQRDCEGGTRASHVFQINYQHFGITCGITLCWEMVGELGAMVDMEDMDDMPTP